MKLNLPGSGSGTREIPQIGRRNVVLENMAKQDQNHREYTGGSTVCRNHVCLLLYGDLNTSFARSREPCEAFPESRPTFAVLRI